MSRTSLRHLAVLTSLVTLAACGGGSSDSPPPPVSVFQGAIAGGGGLTIGDTTFATDGANIVVNGAAAQPTSALQAGRIARVQAVVSPGAAQAVEVRIDPVFQGLSGPVSTTALSRRMDVRGQSIAVDDQTFVADRNGNPAVFDDVRPGTDRIAVHGFTDDSGIRATRIEVLPGTADDFELKGFVANLDTAAKSFDLKLTPTATTSLPVVLAASASLPAGIQNGSYVEVRSTTPGRNPITAASVHLEDSKLGANAEAEVEGVVSSGDASSFVVMGTTVTTTASTRFENGVRADLVPGVKVEAEGTLDANGVLQARKVSFRSIIRFVARPTDITTAGTAVTSFKVLGFTVRVDEFTDLRTAVTTGQAVEVRARRHGTAANEFVATRVDDEGGETRVFIQGPVQSFDATARTLNILGVTVDASGAGFRDVNDAPVTAAAFFGAVSQGKVVKARADAFTPGSSFVADQVELEGDR